MKRTLAGLGVLAALLLGTTTDAHHSQVAVYKATEEQKIEGTLAQVMIRSPHSWVHVETKAENGEIVRYAIEWGGATQLRNAGVDGKTLRVGEKVRVTGRPGRNAADHRLLMVHIETLDGRWSWGNRSGEVVD
jgi:uncharacterized protein DUF6152